MNGSPAAMPFSADRLPVKLTGRTASLPHSALTRRRLSQTFGDGLGPADALERARALRADAAHRVQEAVRVVGAALVVVDLGAQRAAGERVLAVARTPVTTPASTVTCIEHASGQSCGHAPWTTVGESSRLVTLIS